MMNAIAVLIGIFLVLFMLFVFGLRFLSSYKMSKLKGNTLDKFKSDKKLILYFYSEKCGACKIMGPIVDSIKEVKVRKIDVFTQEGAKLAQELGIMGTPTTILLEKGTILQAFIGVKKKEDLLNTFKQ